MDALVTNEAMAHRILWLLCGCVIVWGIVLWVYFGGLRSRECSSLSAAYGDLNGRVHSMTTDILDGYALRDMYVKTAFSCCNGGGVANDYVDMCALKAVLLQGARCLDMEIYSQGDTPVVASSGSTAPSFFVKETYNAIPFADVLKYIVSYGFAGSTAACPNDPLLLHLRIRSAKTEVYDQLAALFAQHADALLGKEYSYATHGGNFAETQLRLLQRKLVIIVDAANPAFEKSPAFCEFVNMTSNSPYMRAQTFSELRNTVDMNELIEFNKTGMTIALPDPGANPENPNPQVLREMGVQLIAMRYPLIGDAALLQADQFFDVAGAAFVLKPEELRHKPILIDKPPEQKPELSFAPREISSDYYKFNI